MGGLLPAAGRVGIAAACLVGLAAIYWPAPQPQNVESSSCPMGFGSAVSSGAELPPGHSPVAPQTSPQTSPVAPQMPSLLYINASIWTGDPQNPWAEALAVQGGRLQAVGPWEAVGKLKRGSDTIVVDLLGRMVLPGFIDAHVHLIPGGLSLIMVDLSQARSRADFVAAVQHAAEAAGRGHWVTGGGWNEQRWGGELPSAAWIDAITPHNPAYLTRMDGHSALANLAALGAAGVVHGTADPEAGHIDRDTDGAATGILSESAMLLVSEKVPPLTLEDRTAAVYRAANHALKHGITTVHDMGRPPFMGGPESAWEDLEGPFMAAADSGKIPIRVVAYMPLSTWERTAALVDARGVAHPGGRLFWGGVKAFSDGSLGSRTALMQEPYADDAATRGMRATPLVELRKLVLQADAAGLQVAIHAIGDQAVDDVSGILRSAAQANGARRTERRHRIEHVQHLSSPAAAAALAAAGTLAVVNPLHLLDDRDVLLPRLGALRSGAGRAFALHTMQLAGVALSYGSDWPVVPLGALRGVYAAAQRRAPGTDDAPYVLSERVAPEAALRAHTTGAAHAAFLEREVGLLRAGMRADFVVLSSSILDAASRADAAELPEVLQTYVDGLCVYGCQGV